MRKPQLAALVVTTLARKRMIGARVLAVADIRIAAFNTDLALLTDHPLASSGSYSSTGIERGRCLFNGAKETRGRRRKEK